MLGVSTMMLHHLSVTFKIYLTFVCCALRCALHRASGAAPVALASTWGVGAKILACLFAHGSSAYFVGSEGCISIPAAHTFGQSTTQGRIVEGDSEESIA
jgi:hypothetical protein